MIAFGSNSSCRALLVAAILFIIGVPVQGQDSGEHDCTKAIRIADIGRPDKKLDWALGTLSGCGPEGADAAARAFASLRTEFDTLALDSLTYPLLAWRDPALLNAGIAIASDPGSTTESRVFALRYLYSLIVPGTTAGYGDLIGVPKRKCGGPGSLTGGIRERRPVASGYVNTLRALGTRLSESASHPMNVRQAALCLADVAASYPPPPARDY